MKNGGGAGIILTTIIKISPLLFGLNWFSKIRFVGIIVSIRMQEAA
jgi:hypothetical protein